MKFTKETITLLDQVNELYPGSVILRGNEEASGVITHDQVSTSMLGTRLMVEVNDGTAPDFLATSELLMMLLTLNGYPQVYFQLKDDDAELTHQLMIMATYLYQPALRAIVYREQAAHGLLTDDVIKGVLAGVQQTLTKETADNNGEAALRLLTLLDLQVFLHAVSSDTTAIVETMTESYPKAWSAAKKIVDPMRIDDIKDPFTVHRAVVTAFSMFDEQMVAWDLPEIYASEFVTLTPVLSERQLRLPLAQVFDIKHMTMKDRNTDKTAYAGLLKNSGQNSFVLAVPEDKLAEFFKELYQAPVKEVLTKLGQPFAIR
ncbi:IpaB/EvcA family protein [Weissella fangxianensis]|uniref:IpaB/EvcA family protein n=1 Tax=Weissella fangxianensis TaxID=2953879 RepID=UPI00215708FD|nr:IpaB/EvcA family protein [Weissella fangxianensis]